MPPCALTYWKYAFDGRRDLAVAGRGLPVSGWWLPIRMVVAVMPGADAVSAAEPDPEEPELATRRCRSREPPLEPQAASSMATTADPATSARYPLLDFFI